jgi:hypothetical protein
MDLQISGRVADGKKIFDKTILPELENNPLFLSVE